MILDIQKPELPNVQIFEYLNNRVFEILDF